MGNVMDRTCPNCTDPEMEYCAVTQMWTCRTCGCLYYDPLAHWRMDAAATRIQDKLEVNLLLDEMGIKHGC